MKTLLLLIVAIAMIASHSLTAQVGISDNGSLPDSSAMLDVNDTTRGVLIPRLTMAQRIAINAPAIGLMIYQTNGTSGFYYYKGTEWTAVASSGVHYPGELFGGGVIFWVDHTGQHGLICGMVDLDTSQVWSNVTQIIIGDSAQSSWNGHGNSIAIVTQPGHVTSAAKLCLEYINADYGTGTFDDWYLPSLAELKLLGNNGYELQKILDTDGNSATTAITTKVYWSSSEYNSSSAWGSKIVFEPDASVDGYSTKSGMYYVRAVRAF